MLAILGTQALALAMSRSAPGNLALVMDLTRMGLVALSAAFVIAYFKPSRPVVGNAASMTRTIAWHRRLSWLQGTDVQSGLVWGVLGAIGLDTPYILARFVVKHQMAPRPVLYARSFASADAVGTYATLVAPALNRNGVLQGLVHTRQPTATLHQAMPPLWRARFAFVPDSMWRAWVEVQLRHASGVVVDVSGSSESVKWELDRSLEVLPRESILVVGGQADAASAGVASIAFGEVADAAQLSRGRQALSDWSARVIGGPSNLPGPTGIRPRFQLPLWLFLWVFVALPGIIAIIALPAYSDTFPYQSRVQAQFIRNAAQQWQAVNDASSCPTVEQLLDERMLDPGGHRYDPWGMGYRIECSSDEVRVISAGPDAMFGTSDDVRVPRE